MLGLLLFFLLFTAGIFLAYRFSSASKVKRRMREALSPFDEMSAELCRLQKALPNEIELSSNQYIQNVYTARLKAIPLDELKKYASGIRLQAIRDVGIRSIADLQGWNASRVSQVRGVGPKSAGAITQAVSTITAMTRAVPINHPTPPFSGDAERLMMQALYRQRWFDTHMAEKSDALAKYLALNQNTRDDIVTKTNFSHWLWKFGSNETIRRNLDKANTMIEALALEDSRSIRGTLSKSLSDCRLVCTNHVPVESIIANFNENRPFYDSRLTSQLGRSGGKAPTTPTPHQTVANAPVASNLVHVEFGGVVPGPPPQPTESKAEFSSPGRHTQESGSEASTGPTPQQAAANGPAASDPVHVEFGRVVPGPPPQPIESGADSTWLETLTRQSGKLISVSVGAGKQPVEFALPIAQRTARSKDLRWLTRGESIQIQNHTLSHGLIYVGEGINSEEHYALNPSLSAKAGNSTPADVAGYCFSYLALNPEQRWRYLDWLADGSSSPIDSGLGMLYFYGLERRVLDIIQGNVSNPPAHELQGLLEEVHRLGNLFQAVSGSVTQCCLRLSDFATASASDGTSVPVLPDIWAKTYELPFIMRYGLGCFMRDGRPVPVEWALRWAYVEPTIYLRTPASRCPQEFEAAFTVTYRERFGDGLIVPANKTKLKLVYQPGWPMHLEPGVKCELRGIPDVAALTGPQHTLKALVEQSTAAIDGYSRYVGRNAKAGTFEALLNLRLRFWPVTEKDRWQKFSSVFVDTMEPMTYAALLQELGCIGDSALVKIADIVRNLDRALVGFEPDVIAGSRRPKPSEMIVLFRLTSDSDSDRTTNEYKRASLTVSLSACIALADGHASEEEAAAVEAMIASWQHLHVDLRTRLRAQYRLQVRQETSLASFRSRFSSLTPAGRMELALALSSLATVDGNIAAAEVKLLEQVYRALGLEPHLLYSHLYGGAQQANPSDSPVVSPSSMTYGYALDTARLAALRLETDQVSALLDGVFVEEETPNTVPHQTANPVSSLETHLQDELLPDLDPKYQRFVAELLQKPSWTRLELEVAAAKIQIMLDGALEHINEAAFDLLGEPLTEGDDPVYVQQNILENAS